MNRHNRNDELQTEYLVEKWDSLLTDERYPIIDYKKIGPLARIFETQDNWNRNELAPRLKYIVESGDGPFSMSADVGGTSMDKYGVDPNNQYPNLIMSILRRAMPRYLGTELAAVVPLSQSVGYIYTLKAFADDLSDNLEPDRQKEILVPGVMPTLYPSSKDVTNPMSRYSTSEAELLGTKNYNDIANADLSGTAEIFHRVKMELQRFSVEVKTRALAASFSSESYDDYAATFNGLDIESELVRILSDQITLDLNQEILSILRRIAKRSINYTESFPGTNVYKFMNSDLSDAQGDKYGRWLSEKTRTLMASIDAQAVKIGQQTGTGMGNVVVLTPNLAALFKGEGLITQAPNLLALSSSLNLDNTFAGILNGQYRVFVDHFFGTQVLPLNAGGGTETVSDYILVGAVNGAIDSGLFFCPYVMMNMFKATDPNSFESKLAFKSRYCIAQNAFCLPSGNTDVESFPVNTSRYYRMFYVNDLPTLFS